MSEVKVPEYVLKDIENTLRLWASINDSYKKETCLDRNTITCLLSIDKILKGKKITGKERFEI